MSAPIDRSARRRRCEAGVIPLLSPATEEFLISKLHTLRPKFCVEIGTARGYSAARIATEIAPRGGQIRSCERSPHDYAIARGFCQGIPNLTLLPLDAMTLPRSKFLDRCDFAFLDGQKSQYASHLENLAPLLQPGAGLLVDDVIKFWHKITPLIDLLKKRTISPEKILLDADADDPDGIFRRQRN